MEFLNFGIKLVEDEAKRARERVVVGKQRRPVGPENPEIELGVEERDFEAVAGDGIAMRLGDAMNEPVNRSRRRSSVVWAVV